MSDLPKIALTRLKAGANSLPAQEHVDANILAAFAERNLPAPERAQVLNHLSQCAECREVAAFIIPVEPETAAVPARVASPKWNPWSLIRWGSLAAALGSLTILVATHSGLWKQNHDVAVSTPPPASADKSVETLTANAPSPPSPPAGQNENYARAQAGALTRQEEALKKSSPSIEANDQHEARLQASERSTRMAASQPPLVLRAENAPAKGLELHETLGDNAVSAASAPTPTVTPAPAPPTASGATAAPGAADKVTSKPMQSTTESVQAEASTVQRKAARGSSGLAGTMAPAQSNAGPPKSAISAKEESHGSMFGMMAGRKDLKLKTSTPAISWGVSREGNVYIFSDGGKTRQRIEIAQGVKFQAVAPNGDEVWAGGENGALFHSLDAGANWTPVRVGNGDGALTETITTIHFPATRHLTIVTVSGSQWISEDDGQHWKAQLK